MYGSTIGAAVSRLNAVTQASATKYSADKHSSSNLFGSALNALGNLFGFK